MIKLDKSEMYIILSGNVKIKKLKNMTKVNTINEDSLNLVFQFSQDNQAQNLALPSPIQNAFHRQNNMKKRLSNLTNSSILSKSLAQTFD